MKYLPAPLSYWTNHVWNMDALDLLRMLPAQSVDAIISDFPYNTTANEWESAIGLSGVLWAEMWRICKPSAPIITTTSQPFTSLLTVKNIKQFRHEWIWEKTRPTGYLNANIAPMKAHESILVFSRNTAIYYPQMTIGEPYRATRGAVGGHIRDKSVGGYETINDGLRYPKSVLHFDSVNGVHPSQKPTDLYEYLILTYTEQGGLVLDPFVGSGTTAVSAKNTKRNYIVGDSDAHYCEIARERLKTEFGSRKLGGESVVSDLPLFAQVTP